MHHAERVQNFTQGLGEITVHFLSSVFSFLFILKKTLNVVMNEHNEDFSAKKKK